jgi:serine protease Do
MKTPALLAVALVTAGGGAAAPARALTNRQIYEQASPSVVVVVATNASAPSDAGIGSGSIVAADGLVLTNFHVVKLGERGVADTIRVFFKPAKLTGSLNKDLVDGVRAAVVATDPGRDLALLSVPSKALRAPPIPIAEELAIPGDPSVAIGSPVDGGPWTLTTGAISNRILDLEGKMGKHAYQIETPINPGNSGGALLDAEARLLGVTTSAVKIGRGGLPTANIQFAVANDVVLDFIQSALVARQEYRELSAGDPQAAARRFASRPESGPGASVAGCAYGVCRARDENALDRIWARMTRLAGAAGARRAGQLGTRLAEKGAPVAAAEEPAAEEKAAPPSPARDAARKTVATLFGGDGEGAGDGLTMAPSDEELEELLPSEGGATEASPGVPALEVTSGTREWLQEGGPGRAERLSAVRWATGPLFRRLERGCGSVQKARECVGLLANSRPAPVDEAPAARPPPASPGRRPSIELEEYATPIRPIEQEQLSGVTRALAANPAVRAADAKEELLALLFRAEPKEALALLKATPGLSAFEPGALKLQRAFAQLEARRWNGARTDLRAVRAPEELKRVADYWLCKSLKLQGRPIGAAQCFKKAGLTEGLRP